MRSAKAPTIRAGAMMAKVIWNIMNTVSGIVATRLSTPTPERNALPRPPMKELRLVTPFSMPVVSKTSE